MPQVYNSYKKHRRNCILPSGAIKAPEELESFIGFLVRRTGDYSTHKLRTMTHDETPYKNTALGQEITTDKLNDFFTPLFGRMMRISVTPRSLITLKKNRISSFKS